jgi:hypothetical protein
MSSVVFHDLLRETQGNLVNFFKPGCQYASSLIQPKLKKFMSVLFMKGFVPEPLVFSVEPYKLALN